MPASGTNNWGKMALRALFVIVSTGLGIGIVLTAEFQGIVHPLVGAGIGAALSGAIIGLEHPLRRVPLPMTMGSVIGFTLGVLLAGVFTLVGSQVFTNHSLMTRVGALAILVVLPYLGIVLGARIGKEGEWSILAKAENPHKGPMTKPKLLDTSVIIDGRIADLCETGFLEGDFIIPQFILQELQHISDSSDGLKRARGRRGLDILNHIQKTIEVGVRVIEDDFPHIKEVDAKLVELAKKLDAKIITNDLNLNKVAELQGVRVLNINDLSNAIKPVVLPGETVRVFVLKEGKEAGQGVAYLDDGTMVVVDNAKRCIGKNIDVVVTSVLQTSAGRMIFTRLREETERDELSLARG